MLNVQHVDVFPHGSCRELGVTVLSLLEQMPESTPLLSPETYESRPFKAPSDGFIRIAASCSLGPEPEQMFALLY